MNFKSIETTRLIIRQFNKDDAMFALSIWNDPVMGEFLNDRSYEVIPESVIKSVEGLGEIDDGCFLIMEDKQSHERIGTCSYFPVNNYLDVAICVHADYWRQHYASETLKALESFWKAEGYDSVVGYAVRENTAANALLLKSGYHSFNNVPFQKQGSEIQYIAYAYKKEL